eukprot:Hpha_TRINITY_DN15431_c1_g4::TRINITY_DN15431_c1_g4_i3::g.174158::m.174158
MFYDQLGFSLPPPDARDEPARQRWEASDQRRQLWATVSAAGGWSEYLYPSEVELEGQEDSHYYELLAGLARVCEQRGERTQKAFRDIERDLHRTCPGHAKEGEVLRVSARVLKAYAVRNPSVGYCQGMNKLAAVLSSVMEEESAFWVLAVIVEHVVPDYYGELEGAVVDLQLLDWMVSVLEPSLWQHLQEIGFSCAVVFTRTLVCLFAACLPTEAVLELWHSIFSAENPRYMLLLLTCSLISLLRAELRSAQDMSAAVDCFQVNSANMYDATRLLAVASTVRCHLDTEAVSARRAEIRDELQREASAVSSFIPPAECRLPDTQTLHRVMGLWQGPLDLPVSREEFGGLLERAGVAGSECLFYRHCASGSQVPLHELLISLALTLQGGPADRLAAVCAVLARDSNREGAKMTGDAGGEDPTSNGAGGANAEERKEDGALGESRRDDGIDKRGFGLLLSYTSAMSSAGSSPPVGEGVLPSPRQDRRSLGGAEDARSVADTVFRQLDQDHDGRLSVAELSEAVLAVPHLSLALGALHRRADAAKQWPRPAPQPDAESESCTLCAKGFKFWRRRHHCRNCGALACDECSSHRWPLPQLGYERCVRVCNRCHEDLEGTPSPLSEDSSQPNALVHGRPLVVSDGVLRAQVEADEKLFRDSLLQAMQVAWECFDVELFRLAEMAGTRVIRADPVLPPTIVLMTVAASAASRAVVGRNRRIGFTRKLRRSLVGSRLSAGSISIGDRRAISVSGSGSPGQEECPRDESVYSIETVVSGVDRINDDTSGMT